LGTIVADIFHEVDEEVRREQLKKLWDRYSIYLIALAVLIVAGMAGWRGYEYWVAKKAAAAGAEFEAAIALNEEGKRTEAEAALRRWQPRRRPAIACSRACARQARLRNPNRRTL
jgi:hypothetical protein